MSEACGSLYFSNKTDIMIGILPGGSDGKESAGNAGELDLIPSFGGFPGEGNSYPLQYSCLENSMDRGAWHAAVPGVAKESYMTLQN